MRRLLVLGLFLFSFAAAQAQPASGAPAGAAADKVSPAGTANPAGKVELAEGEVAVYDKTKQSRRVKPGDTVLEGESIVTGTDGELHLSMEDGGFIAVRPNTKMRIVAYQARGEADDKGVFSLLQGAFRSVTGWIGKYNPRSYQVRTPTATIGVRGTDHEPLVIPQGSREGEPGTYDKVNIGGSFIQTPHGRVDVAPDRAAFAPLRGKAPPRVLTQVPGFYRPTRNEHLLAGKHEQIHKVLEQRRDERRKVFEERRKSLERQRKDAHAQRQHLREERHQKLQEERRTHLQEPRPHPGAAEHRPSPERRPLVHEQRPRLQPGEGRPERRKPEGEHVPRGKE